MNQIKQVLSEAGLDEVPVPHVVPVPGGGVQLEWYEGSRELEIEFTGTGDVEYLAVDEEDDDDQEREGPLLEGEVARLRELLAWVTHRPD